MLSRRTFIAGAPLALAGCAAEPVWAPDDMVARAAYRHPGPSTLTLFTMKNTSSGNGAHSGLMISASQRVIFDPAGTFSHPSIPERNDLVYGITPRVEQFYVSYHARETFFVLRQTMPVDPGVAEAAFTVAKTAGPVRKAQCTVATVALLRQLPGFGHLRSSLFPNVLAEQFAVMPGVVEREHRETDPDDNSAVLSTYWDTAGN